MFRQGNDVSEEAQMAIDREVKSILLEGQVKARTILGEHRDDMDGLAKLLLEKENLGRKDLDEFFGETPEATEATVDEGSRTDEVLRGDLSQVRHH